MATVTAFEGTRQIATGDLATVAAATKLVLDRGERAPVLIFDNDTSRLVELDLRHSPAPVPEPIEEPKKPGRPKLGVVAKEITLLPRHWEWLSHQPGGASVTLRKLIDEARNVNAAKDKIRQSQESAYRFMSAMAGNEPGFEEALRALFARERTKFDAMIADWPIDVRDHSRKLATPALD